MKEQVYEQLTLFQEDFRASRFPWLESKKVGKTTVIYGQRCEGLSPSLSRVGYSVRTYLESCELLLPMLSRTWSVSAITSSCLILKQRVLEPHTTENESRLWPTVTVCGNYQHTGASKKAGTGLATAARMWPTPIAGNCGMTARTSGRPIEKSTKLQTQVTLEERKKLFKTPCAACAVGSTGGKGHRDLRTDIGGQLNPTWVEWLMGFPTGWTELKD